MVSTAFPVPSASAIMVLVAHPGLSTTKLSAVDSVPPAAMDSGALSMPSAKRLFIVRKMPSTTMNSAAPMLPSMLESAATDSVRFVLLSEAIVSLLLPVPFAATVSV